MPYQRGDNRYGRDERWRGRDPDRSPTERSAYGEQDLGRGYGRSFDWDRGDRGRDERGFFERAGDEVRSWFSEEDDRRSRDRDRGRFFGGDDDDRRGFQGSGRGGRFSEEYGGGRSEETFGSPGYGGTSGFGGGPDHGRRFDRIDAGSTGTHGAHPMSSPVGGAYGGGYGISSGGSFGDSSARFAAAGSGGFGGRGGDVHDRNYSEWRSRQIDELDRDYDEYRREHQSKFEQEFGGWRQKRQGQRQSLGRVSEQMEVLGSDGQHIGTVDKVRGDRIVLTKNDETAGGVHHSIPCSWIETVDDKVTVNKSAQEAIDSWREEERSRALFEREDQGSGGPHMLNRSFSGTYSKRDE